MTDKEFIEFLKDKFSLRMPVTAREVTFNQSVINRLNDIEKKLEVLKIIKEKEIAVDELKRCIKECGSEALDEYNAFAGDKNSLNEEHFNEVKRWLEK